MVRGKNTDEATGEVSNEVIGFAALGLGSVLLTTLRGLGYEEPTPIQCQAIPKVLAGGDLIGQAATGTGKTAAFALPLIEKLAQMGKGRPQPSVLVLVPTRELAMQVAEAVHRYGASAGVRALPVYGGQSYEQQIRALRRGVDIVIATPGRALDHIGQKTIDLSGVSTVVLDEADEMLDMGFLDDIDNILAATPKDRQVVLFSATLPPRIVGIAKRYMKNPERIQVAQEQLSAGSMPRIRQTAYLVTRSQKALALSRLLDVESPSKALIFCRTRHEVDELAETLAAHGRGVEGLHGGMTQVQRERVIRKLREGKVDLVVATDVAARGLDIEQLSHVFNFDVPSAPESYVHRIGRVGRAGREGVAITLAEPREHRLLRNIEYVTKQKIDVGKIPTIADLRARRIELTRTALRDVIVAGGTDGYRAVVEALADEFDLMEIAMAAVKMLDDAAGPKDGRTSDAEELVDARMRPDQGDRKGGGRPQRSSGSRVPMARLHINLGRSAGVLPKDLVGAIAGEAGISGKQIGAIEIADRFSIVDVEMEVAETVIAAMKQATIKGKKVAARPFVAGPAPKGGPGPKPSHQKPKS